MSFVPVGSLEGAHIKLVHEKIRNLSNPLTRDFSESN